MGRPLTETLTPTSESTDTETQSVLIELGSGVQADIGEALSLVEDTEAVNQALAQSGRSDLIITRRAAMRPIAELLRESGPEDTNNFDRLGLPAITRLLEGYSGGLSDLFSLRLEGQDARALMALREAGLPLSQKEVGLFTQSHLRREAFARLWYLLPEITEHLILEHGRENATTSSDCGTRPIQPTVSARMLYLLSSRLVSATDSGVLNTDGTVNDYYLCA